MTAKLTLVLIIALYMALSIYGIWPDLPYPRTANEVEQIKLALKFGTGDLNPHYFLHPPFFSYALCFIYSVCFVTGKALGIFKSVMDYQRIYFTDPSFFYAVARFVVLILGSSSVAIFYFLSKKIFDKRIAIVAAVFIAVSPLYVKLSHYALSDIPLLFITLASFYFLLNIYHEGRLRDYIFAGLLLGIATATKYNAGLLIVPMVAAHFLSPSQSGWKTKILDPKLLVIPLCALSGFLLGNPYAILDSKTFLASFSEQSRRMNAFDYNFASWKTDKPGWIYIITDTMPFGLGYSLSALILCGILYSFYRRKKEDYILLSLIFSAYLVIGRWSIIKPRYFIFIFPFAILLAARFLIEVIGKFKFAHRTNIYAGIILVIGLMAEPLSKSIEFDRLAALKPVYAQAKDWIEANIPSGAAIATMTRIPIFANETSIRRKLKKIEDKRIGQGIMLKTMLRHLGSFHKLYDIHELPYPWREDYEEGIFDFNARAADGIKYYIFTQEADEYYSDRARYGKQVKFMDDVKNKCGLVKEFRQPRPKIEPGYISNDEYVHIYHYKR